MRQELNHSNTVIRKQERRYQLLKELWNAVGGTEHKTVDFMLVAKDAGFDEQEATEIYDYFWGEGFFENRIVRWGVSLSHRAIVEMERSLSNPEKATEHFSTTVIQHFSGPVGAVQTGPGTTANVNQNIGPSMSEVAELIKKVREDFHALPQGTREEALDVIDGLSEELQQPIPSKGKVRAFLAQVGVFAQDTASGASAALLADAITKALGLQ